MGSRTGPRRKLGYNLFVTMRSVGVAFGIGLIEASGLLGDRMGLAAYIIDRWRRRATA